jgi:hypothetical protein
VFATDVLVCDTCGGAMRILAILPEGDASRSILEHLGLPTEPPPPRAVGPTVDVLMAALDAEAADEDEGDPVATEADASRMCRRCSRSRPT